MTSHDFLRVLARACCLFALSAGCSPSVAVDAPSIEVTRPDIAFDGVTVPPNFVIPPSVSFEFSMSTSKLGASSKDGGAPGSLTELRVHELRLLAHPGGDLSFLDSLRLVATNPPPSDSSSPASPVIEVVNYVNPNQVDYGSRYRITTLRIPVDPPVDLLPLWRRTTLKMTITASGLLPESSWAVDAIFALSAHMETN